MRKHESENHVVTSARKSSQETNRDHVPTLAAWPSPSTKHTTSKARNETMKPSSKANTSVAETAFAEVKKSTVQSLLGYNPDATFFSLPAGLTQALRTVAFPHWIDKILQAASPKLRTLKEVQTQLCEQQESTAETGQFYQTLKISDVIASPQLGESSVCKHCGTWGCDYFKPRWFDDLAQAQSERGHAGPTQVQQQGLCSDSGSVDDSGCEHYWGNRGACPDCGGSTSGEHDQSIWSFEGLGRNLGSSDVMVANPNAKHAINVPDSLKATVGGLPVSASALKTFVHENLIAIKSMLAEVDVENTTDRQIEEIMSGHDALDSLFVASQNRKSAFDVWNTAAENESIVSECAQLPYSNVETEESRSDSHMKVRNIRFNGPLDGATSDEDDYKLPKSGIFEQYRIPTSPSPSCGSEPDYEFIMPCVDDFSHPKQKTSSKSAKDYSATVESSAESDVGDGFEHHRTTGDDEFFETHDREFPELPALAKTCQPDVPADQCKKCRLVLEAGEEQKSASDDKKLMEKKQQEKQAKAKKHSGGMQNSAASLDFPDRYDDPVWTYEGVSGGSSDESLEFVDGDPGNDVAPGSGLATGWGTVDTESCENGGGWAVGNGSSF